MLAAIFHPCKQQQITSGNVVNSDMFDLNWLIVMLMTVRHGTDVSATITSDAIYNITCL